MHTSFALSAFLGLAALCSGAAVPGNVLARDDVLPDPSDIISGFERFPVDNHHERFMVPEVTTYDGNQLEAEFGNATEAPASADVQAAVAALQARQIIGEDNRWLETRTDHPFRTAGRIQIRGPGWVGHCSGTLVGARLVLTARHCLGDGATYRFQPNYHNGERAGGHDVSRVIYVKGKNEDDGGCGWKNDFAIFVLGSKPGRGFMGAAAFKTSQSNAALEWWSYGYPGDLSGGRSPYAQRNFRLWTSSTCGGPLNGAIRGSMDLARGQSGSPVWLNGNGALIHGVAVGAVSGANKYNLISHGQQIVDAILKARKDFP